MNGTCDLYIGCEDVMSFIFVRHRRSSLFKKNQTMTTILIEQVYVDEIKALAKL